MYEIDSIGSYIDLETYVNLDTINPENFIEPEIPVLHPASIEYKHYWKEQRRRCMEGYWHSGRWMPPKLYFYVNFGVIKRNVKRSIVKKYARPLLHDLEWMFFYNWEEARGFSGFDLDPRYSCNTLLLNEFITDQELINNYCVLEGELDKARYNNLFTKTGERKVYQPARQYLRKIHKGNYGRPLHFNEAKNLMMLGSRGFGKDLHEDTLLHTKEGLVKIKDIQVGNYIYGNDGKLTTVTNKYEFINQEQIEFTLNDGRTIISGKGHKWFVYDAKTKSEKIVTTEDIISNFKYGNREDNRWFLPQNSPIEYEEKKYDIHPYLLGVLLGDGGMTDGVRFTTNDIQIVEEVTKVIPQNTKVSKQSGKLQYSIVGTKYLGRNIHNPLKDSLGRLGLMELKSTEKFIPREYLLGNVQQRLELLRGLMDTDGYCNTKGNIEFSSSSARLAYDVVTLIRSLGIKCNIIRRKTKCEDNYRVLIKTDLPIFKLKRKLERLNTTSSNYTKRNREWSAITSWASKGVSPSYCISVDNASKLFIANDFIVTHNSYSVGIGIILHEWLFDGLTYYVPSKDIDTSAEIVVGAADAKYSADLLDKAATSLERIAGVFKSYKKTYPSPLSKQFKGTWTVGKQITSLYDKKVNGRWDLVGTGSNIKHRTFKDNPFAAQGTRPGVLVYEEVGMFNNLLECYGATVENQRDGSRKFGSMMFLGTGGDFEGGGCICAGSKVFRANGTVCNIEDLVQEDGILGFNLNTNKVSKEPISYWQTYTEKECVKITTNTGRILECSKDHPILYSKVNNFRSSKKVNGKRIYKKKVDWKSADQLQTNWQVCLPDKNEIYHTHQEKDAYLLGLLLGDGSYCSRGAVKLSNADFDILNYVEKTYKTTTSLSRICKDGRVYKEISVLNFRNKLRQYGMFGQTKDKKKLPNNIHSWDKKSITDFLSGVIDADGNINKDSIELSSAYKDLLGDIQFLMERLGIFSTIRKRTSKPNALIKTESIWYVLRIKDVRSLKRATRIFNFKNKKKDIKLIKLRVYLKSLKTNQINNLPNLRFETIKSIEEIGVKQVFNLTADTTNTYISNNIITHNTVAAYEMFYNPDKYDLLEFEDIWEMKGKISYFVPAYLGFRENKDAQGKTDIKTSIITIESERKKLRASKGSMKRLEEEIQNRPVKPSEMFLSRSGNWFPIVELKDRLSHLESADVDNTLEKKVDLVFDSKSPYGASYKLDLGNNLRAVNKFPWNDSNRTGCVVIYEFPLTSPDGSVPEGLYIIGHDPVASDSSTGESLSSTVVLKTKKHWDKFGHDEIVAVYVGRPYEGRQTVNENLLKLSMLYGNAKVYFENSVGNVKEYFEKMKRLDLLAKQPTTVFAKKASFTGTPAVIYGYPMNNIKFKLDGIQYVRDWLLEERGSENGKTVRNIDRIWDKALLQELISFDLQGNYDRVMSLMGAIIGLNEIHNQYENTLKQVQYNTHTIDLSSIIGNKKLFQSLPSDIVGDIKQANIDWGKLL